jgi:hypothetical protein
MIAALFGPVADSRELVFNRQVVVHVFEVRGARFHALILGQTFGTSKSFIYGPSKTVPKLTLCEASVSVGTPVGAGIRMP